MKRKLSLWIKSIVALAVFIVIQGASAEPMHAISLYDEPKYKQGFTHFDYVNPNAPKGGHLKEASFSSFDTLNPFVINGVSAPGVGLMYDTLMKQSADEPFSLYGLIAESIDISEDRSAVTFQINPNARFSNNSPITAEDVIFSFNILREQGVPMYRAYYRDVVSAEALSPTTVVFHLTQGTNRELPLILGELPILPKAYWETRDFSKTSLEIPVTSGPYLIEKIEPNRSVSYRRNPDYWAKDLNVNKGMYNFDKIRYDVYRDTTVAVEAFKAGLIDIRLENEAKKWQVLSQSDLVKEGKVKAKILTHQLPAGMQGFVFNLRRPIFQNPLVRKALGLAFDFDWTNKHLFHSAYQRTASYFENSYLKAPPLPSERELTLLEPYRAQLPSSVFTTAYQPPASSGTVRQNLSHALALLYKAGYRVDRVGKLRHPSGTPFQFEILLDSSSGAVWERVVLPYIDRLKRLGIEASIRTVDSIQYKNRMDKYEYDMMVMAWGQSLSPGNEQRYYWGSDSAKTEGSWNFIGIQSPVVDDLIEKIISATTQEDHLTAVHALDRVLLHSHFVIPHWYTPEHRYLYWNKFELPSITPMKGTNVLWWWMKKRH
jgi:microcin C transport system substrate-binding protein